MSSLGAKHTAHGAPQEAVSAQAKGEGCILGFFPSPSGRGLGRGSSSIVPFLTSQPDFSGLALVSGLV